MQIDLVSGILLLMMLVVPGIVFYWSFYSTVGMPFGERSKVDLAVLTALGAPHVLLIWSLPLLPYKMQAVALIRRIVNAISLAEGLVDWWNLLHYFAILLTAVALGLVYGNLLLMISRSKPNSLMRRSFGWFGTGYRLYLDRINNLSNQNRQTRRAYPRTAKNRGNRGKP